MKLINPRGEEVYYNDVVKHGLLRYVVVAANEKTVSQGKARLSDKMGGSLQTEFFPRVKTSKIDLAV